MKENETISRDATHRASSITEKAWGVALRDYGVLLLILGVGAWLRIERINYDGLVFDEQWHMELSTGRGSAHISTPQDQYIPDAPAVTSLVGAPPWYSVWTHMDLVVHPPLYCTILRLWRDAFGQGDISARALSILCSLLTIAFMFMAAREVHGLAPAAWAAAIFAVVPTQIAFAQQVRGYDLMGAEAIAALWALVRLEKYSRQGASSRSAAIALGIFVLAMLLTHYFAMGAAAAIGGYVLIRFKGRARRDALIALVAAGMVFLITWGPFMWKQRRYVTETADPWLMEHDPRHLAFTFMRLGSWPLRVMFDVDRVNLSGSFTSPWMNGATASVWPIIPGMLLVIPLWMLRRRPDLLLWCIWLGGTLGFITLLDLIRGTSHLRFIRYIWLSTPAILMIGMLMLKNMPAFFRHAIPAMIVVLGVIFGGMAFTSDEPDWRDLGKYVEDNARHDEPLIFASGMQPSWYSQIFYLGVAHYSHGFPRGIVKLTGDASPKLMQEIPGATAWVISGPLRSNPPRVTADDIAALLPGATIIDQQVFPDLAICTHVQLNHPPATTR